MSQVELPDLLLSSLHRLGWTTFVTILDQTETHPSVLPGLGLLGVPVVLILPSRLLDHLLIHQVPPVRAPRVQVPRIWTPGVQRPPWVLHQLGALRHPPRPSFSDLTNPFFWKSRFNAKKETEKLGN